MKRWIMQWNPRARTRNGLAVALALLGSSWALTGCGSDPPTRMEVPASCPVETQSWPSEGQQHAMEGTPLTFASNPPSSGTHYPVWGRWGQHSEVLERGYYVHNLEHGGIVLLYHCETACPDIVAALKSVVDSRPQDPACDTTVRSRIVLTEDPLLDVPVAAASWQNTYRAQCADLPSLTAFANAHYDQAPESLCNQGYVPLN